MYLTYRLWCEEKPTALRFTFNNKTNLSLLTFSFDAIYAHLYVWQLWLNLCPYTFLFGYYVNVQGYVVHMNEFFLSETIYIFSCLSPISVSPCTKVSLIRYIIIFIVSIVQNFPMIHVWSCENIYLMRCLRARYLLLTQYIIIVITYDKKHKNKIIFFMS